MTTLDLNAYGVTEMSHAEKVEENGGWIGVALAIVGIAIYLYDNRESIADGIEEGYDKTSKALNG